MRRNERGKSQTTAYCNRLNKNVKKNIILSNFVLLAASEVEIRPGFFSSSAVNR